MKTGLNDMKMEFMITASLKRISFFKHFLKILEDFHYSLQRHGHLNQTGSAVSLYDVITLASMFRRQRHHVSLFELLVRVMLNNSEKECGCSSLMCL